MEAIAAWELALCLGQVTRRFSLISFRRRQVHLTLVQVECEAVCMQCVKNISECFIKSSMHLLGVFSFPVDDDVITDVPYRLNVADHISDVFLEYFSC